MKPVEAADRAASERSGEARLAERAWWRRVPRLLTSPREVFRALREDDDTDVEARSEPILAIVLVAGTAGILLTPAWGTLLDDQSLDWLVLCVITFIGALFYGTAGYFLLGFAVWVGARGVGLDTRARPARQLVAFSALPFALSVLVTLPAILLGFGYDWFRTGGSDAGTGRAAVLLVALALTIWSVALLALGLRTTFRLPWRGVAGVLALAAVVVAVFAVLPTIL
jgi:hypothetical protein